MKKLTTELLKTRRAHLGRRKFLIKLPLITAFALAAQSKPLFAQYPEILEMTPETTGDENDWSF
jgi:hypothetical protein